MCCIAVIGCSTPRMVEEQHHQSSQIDTAAVMAQVDRRLTSWHEEMDAFFRNRIDQYVSEQQQTEQQHETITETITTTVDSLGREMRQEQRTTNRSMVNVQWSMVNQVTREYESRLQTSVDSLDSCWRQRYDSLSARLASSVSSQASSTPVGDTRPWYTRIWDAMRYICIGIVLVGVVWIVTKVHSS